MAVKNHLLDDKIIKSAKAEFMQYGFAKASLHKIAEKAGITTGALYTRYKSKDELFTSLISIPTDKYKDTFLNIASMYNHSKESKNVDDFLATIRIEEQLFIDILFEYYDECLLLICKSDGSEIGKNLQNMISLKAQGTADFFADYKNENIDTDAIELILCEQFSFYKQILQKGYDKQKAVSIVKTFEVFLESGWETIYELLVK